MSGDENGYLFGSNYIDDSKIDNHEIQTIIENQK